MSRLLPLGLAATLFLAFASVQAADENYAIKLRGPKPGETTWHERSTNVDMLIRLIDSAGDLVIDRHIKGTGTATFWQQVLARSKDGEDTKLRRGYGSARFKGDEGLKKLPFEGKLVVFQKDARGKFAFSLASGAKLIGKNAGQLDTEFNRGASLRVTDFLPGRPVKVGESWALDPSGFEVLNEQGVNFQLDATKAKATAHLKKIHDKDGVAYGVIVGRFEVPVLSLTTAKRKFVFTKGSTFISQLTADTPIDGSSPFGSFKSVTYLKCADTVLYDGKKFKLSAVIRFDQDETVSAPKK